MAEVIGLYMGIVASIGGLLQLSEVIIEYLRNTMGAKEQMNKLITEIIATKVLLEELRDTAKEPEWSNTLESLEKPGGPLELLRSSLEELDKKAKLSRSQLNKITKRLVWQFDRGEYEEILSRIERSKALLSLALQMYMLSLMVILQKEHKPGYNEENSKRHRFKTSCHENGPRR
jgi:hypothetical protein